LVRDSVGRAREVRGGDSGEGSRVQRVVSGGGGGYQKG